MLVPKPVNVVVVVPAYAGHKQEAGSVKVFVVNVQAGSAENTAETAQPAVASAVIPPIVNSCGLVKGALKTC